MVFWLCLGWTLVAGGYQLIALLASLRHLKLKDPAPTAFPPVSIFKPVRGLDDRFYEAIRSHAELDYPDFELLFGVQNPQDPAIPMIRRLQQEFPQRCIRLIQTTHQAPNGKVGVLMELAQHARHGVWLVNDSDIKVNRDYLRHIIGWLEDDRTGLVTCLYRPQAASFPARFEALGIATDFAPSVLVAPFVGIAEFGLGSTLAFRRDRLDRIGGFAAISDYIADDYQLGKQISQLGYVNRLTRMVVETGIGGETWTQVWHHQLRWARTIRLSRAGGYAGLPITMAVVWAVLDFACRQWMLGLGLLLMRYVVALVAAGLVLRSPQAMADVWLTPFRDLWGAAIWVAGVRRAPVVWRDKVLELDAHGRIVGSVAKI